MRKFKWIVGIFLLLIIILASVGSYFFFPIMSGYSAKAACSCVFNSGRSLQDVVANELSILPLNFTSVTINNKDSSATASVFGFAIKKAIFRRGLGCTLLNQSNEKVLRNTQFIPTQSSGIIPDSVEWPLGNKNLFSSQSSYDSSSLHQAFAYAFTASGNKSKYGTRSLIVVHHGKIIKEQYVKGYTPDMPQTGWSMSKSITNALIGILVKDGKLTVDQNNLFAEWAKDDRKNITLGNLLNANSGLAWKEVYNLPSPATKMLYGQDDMPRFAMNFPLDEKPGTHFKYSSGTSNMLSGIIRQKAGAGYYNFVYDKLFNKIGMHSAIMEPDAGGTFVGSSYCFASARDWARFGLLYLNDGMINGERILPEGWVKYTTTPAVGALKGEYGAQFWLNAGEPGNPTNRTYPDVPTDCFFAEGYQGQQVFIIPGYDAVIVRLSLQNTTEFDENKFIAEVLRAIKK